MSLKKFIGLFKGRRDCYGQQSFCMKEPLTEQIFQEHIDGKRRVGVYPLHNGDGTGPGKWASWIAADIDDGSFEKAEKIQSMGGHLGITGYIEVSKGKGYHVFFFFDADIEAYKLRMVLDFILEKLGFKCELFPKQDETAEGDYGNFINLPLFGSDIKNGKTIFMDTKQLPLIESTDDLDTIDINSHKGIDMIIENNQLKRKKINTYNEEHSTRTAPVKTPPCIEKIKNGEVKQGEHNEAWFRLAIYYKERNIPHDDVINLLEDWNKKNPNKNKVEELRRTVKSVFEKDYKSFPCGEGVLARLCNDKECPIVEIHQKKKDIQEGIITLVFRNEDVMVFRMKDYEFRISTFEFMKSGQFRCSLTLSKDKKIIFKDMVNLNIASHRKRYIKAAEDNELEDILIKLHDLVRQQLEKEEKERMLKPKQLYIMTEKEKEVAVKYLQETHDILAKVIDVTNRMGVVGEETVRMMVYLSFTSRITKNPLSITVKGESSSGKSFSCQNVQKLIPEEGYHFITRATQQAFYHMPEDGLQNRIVYINEMPGSESADYSIRSAQSEGDLILMLPIKDPNTGDMVTIQKTVKGPVGFLVTTTKAQMFDENETRNFSVFSDDSPELTKNIGRITIRKAKGEEFIVNNEELNRWRNIQRLLNPDLKVIIPYADEVFSSFPDRPVRIRRDRERFRVLIEIVTLLHQYHRVQKKQDDKMVVISTLADYYLAKTIAGKLLTYTIYEIGPSAEDMWKAINLMSQTPVEGRVPGQDFTFKYKELAEFMGWGVEKIKKWMFTLIRAGLIDYADKSTGGKGKASLFKVSKDLGKQFSSESLKFLPEIDLLSEAYPCDETLFYDPITGEKVNLKTMGAPEGLLDE